jgi:Fis family transcriptional regulator, factor for inversion stimulation protein
MSRVMSLADGLGGTPKTVIDITGYPSLRDVERDYFLAVLDSVGGNKAHAAKILGIAVKSVYNKLEYYGAQGFGPLAGNNANAGTPTVS